MCPRASWSVRPRKRTATTPPRSACRWPRRPSRRRGPWPSSCGCGCWPIRSWPGLVETIEVAGPGFLNFTLSGTAYAEAMAEMLGAGRRRSAGVRRAPIPGSTWSSSASIPTARCTWATVATPPTATRSIGCWPSAASNVSTEFYINDYRAADGPLRSQRRRPVRPVLRRRPAGPRRRLPGGLRQRHRRGRPSRGGRPLRGGAPDRGRRPGVSDQDCDGYRRHGPQGRRKRCPRLQAIGADPRRPRQRDEAAEWPALPEVDEAIAFFRARGCAADARRDASGTGELRRGVRLLVQRDDAARERAAGAGHRAAAGTGRGLPGG